MVMIITILILSTWWPLAYADMHMLPHKWTLTTILECCFKLNVHPIMSAVWYPVFKWSLCFSSIFWFTIDLQLAEKDACIKNTSIHSMYKNTSIHRIGTDPLPRTPLRNNGMAKMAAVYVSVSTLSDRLLRLENL